MRTVQLIRKTKTNNPKQQQQQQKTNANELP